MAMGKTIGRYSLAREDCPGLDFLDEMGWTEDNKARRLKLKAQRL